MKYLLIFISLFAFSFQQNWYSGSTATSLERGYSTFGNSFLICTSSTTYAQYQKFTVLVTSPNFYYVTALVEKDFRQYAQLQIYNGVYYPNSPCTNFLTSASATSSAPHINLILYLNPGNYTFVVTSNSYDAGLFAIHVDAANYNLTTNENQDYWNFPTEPGTFCYDSGITAPYNYVTFTQPTTGNFDIVYFGYNDTSNPIWNLGAALYQGVPSFISQFSNMTYPVSACESSLMTRTRSDDSDLHFDNLLHVPDGTWAGAAAANVALVGGMTYTIVISTYNSFLSTGKFGIITRPTVVRSLSNSTVITAPQVFAFSTVYSCVPDVTKYYGVVTFTPTSAVYVIDCSTDYLDTAAALYQGTNNPPSTCPTSFLMAADTGDGAPLARVLNVGVTHTIVTFPYTSSLFYGGSPYALYIYSGVLLGIPPVNSASTTGQDYYSTYSYTTYSYTTYSNTGYSSGSVSSETDNNGGIPSYLNKGAIIAGGVVGGILAIGAIAGVLFVLVHKSRSAAPISPEVQ